LSNLEELQLLRLGVASKAARWRTLGLLADADPRLDRARLGEIFAWADGELGLLEDLRMRAARAALGQGPAAEG
jgi:hypothetical protein